MCIRDRYFLERAFQTRSARDLWLFSLSLYLAILSHYSAIFLAISAGVYVLVRLWDSEPDLKFAVTWAGGQVGGVLLCIFQYATHLSKIKGLLTLVLDPYQGDMLHW